MHAEMTFEPHMCSIYFLDALKLRVDYLMVMKVIWLDIARENTAAHSCNIHIMYVYVCIYVCTCMCIYVCMYVCMYVVTLLCLSPMV